VVVAVEAIELQPARPETAACAAGSSHVRARCLLPHGHDGYHEARVRVRRENGVVVSYLYGWRDG
jgi:hypothetical protein